MKPNTLILRIADVDGSKTFVNLPLDDEGIIQGQDAHEFQVFDGDSYNLLGFDQLVFAVSSDGGESTLELARVTIKAKHDSDPVVCHESPPQVAAMAKEIFDDWENAMAAAEETE